MKDMLVIVHVYRNGKNVGQQSRYSVDENVNYMQIAGTIAGGYFFPLHISMS